MKIKGLAFSMNMTMLCMCCMHMCTMSYAHLNMLSANLRCKRSYIWLTKIVWCITAGSICFLLFCYLITDIIGHTCPDNKYFLWKGGVLCWCRNHLHFPSDILRMQFRFIPCPAGSAYGFVLTIKTEFFECLGLGCMMNKNGIEHKSGECLF